MSKNDVDLHIDWASQSKMISIALNLLKKQNPNLRLVISYADSEQNHSGTIYQAGNWVYIGDSIDTNIVVMEKRWYRRSLGSKYGTNSIEWIRKNIDKNAYVVKTKPKYKYLMPLDKEMRKQVEKLSKPYPKKEKLASVV